MTTVRNATKTTATLITLIIVIALLTHFFGKLTREPFYGMGALLRSKTLIGGFHSALLSISFWLLLMASGVEAIFRENSGVYIFGSFRTPLIFSLCFAVLGIIALLARINIIWFWLFYFIGLIVCVKIAFGGLSRIKGAGPSKIKLFFTSPPSKNDADVSIVDRWVLYVVRFVMLVDWFALLLSFVIFCIQNRHIVGL